MGLSSTEHIAKHYHEFYFGGNWTVSSLKALLEDVTWNEAITKVKSFNTIASLFYHIHYFTEALIPVLEGKALDAHDKFSYDVSPIRSAEDWNRLRSNAWARAELLTRLISAMPASKLQEVFSEEKYGTYYRNLHGLIEHSHYHLGQIALLKKYLKENPSKVTLD